MHNVLNDRFIFTKTNMENDKQESNCVFQNCLPMIVFFNLKQIYLSRNMCTILFQNHSSVYIYNTIDDVLSTLMTKRCSVCTEVLTDILAIFATLFEEQMIL